MRKRIVEHMTVGRFDYTVVRSGRRSMALTLGHDGCPLVRAPFSMSDERVSRFVLQHEDWLLRAIERFHEQQAREELTDGEVRALKQRAAEVLPQKVAYYAELMGVTPTGVRITAAKTRFGSCSPKDSLCFSYRLMLWQDAAIDYVVVHELAHILHKNHSPAFHREIAQILPDHKARRALLKQPPARKG